jgi:hypothetical protein
MDELRIQTKFLRLQIEVAVAFQSLVLVDFPSGVLPPSNLHQHESQRYSIAEFFRNESIEVDRSLRCVVSCVDEDLSHF